MRQPPRLGPRTVEWTATTQKSPERGPRRTRSSSCSRVTGGRSTAGGAQSAPPRGARSGRGWRRAPRRGLRFQGVVEAVAAAVAPAPPDVVAGAGALVAGAGAGVAGV